MDVGAIYWTISLPVLSWCCIMSKNSVGKVKQEQKYKILIRNLRKQQEKKDNEKTNDKKTDSNQSK